MPLSILPVLPLGAACSPLNCGRAVQAVRLAHTPSFVLPDGLSVRQPFVHYARGFLAPQLFPDSSQSAVLRQSRLQGIKGFAGLKRRDLQLAVQFLVAYGDASFGGDTVKQEIGRASCRERVEISVVAG